ncbi:flagellar hook assembly protein FlgD [Antarcticirhabdus aurantiaca]|uniref:Flagellar hook assembly protein FlgD n=1 Tax=Antarcticirhabdus aurantiaca TaxID=2606717 RepID=A0ACD4NTQ0_9HYPH|nr:flagellar hook assembly protein FlgD [Antarcticirhabdus aurantiaca]WAJ29982.1 flagellar hook assembly protein FlgD [Jeongeuplla avenae]
MTTVNPTSATTTAATAVSQATKDGIKTGLDYNAFLQLLVAQMKNQDPLNPTDPTQQMSQLASFSNVEQSIKLNQKLAAMTTLTALTQADSLVGRTVTSGDGATSGVVKSVRITDDGVTATLTSGKTMALGAGTTIE